MSRLEWDVMLDLASEHQVVPLLYRRLRELGWEAGMPVAARDRLQKGYWRSAGRSIRLFHELSSVLAALREDGIAVVALKGAHLAPIVYGNLALRPMADVDLLVKGQDLVRAGERLVAIGYDPTTPAWRETIDAAGQHLPPFSRRAGLWIEIHRTIVSPVGPERRVAAHLRDIDVGGLWERARPSDHAELRALTLSPEDLLLHLCLHISLQDRFRVDLKALCDVMWTIRHYGTSLDWRELWCRARKWSADRSVFLTLHVAHELLGAQWPGGALGAAPPQGFDSTFVATAEEQIFAERARDLPDMRNLALMEQGPLTRRLRAALRTVFPAPEVLATLYPASPHSKKVYAYYPRRLWDLLHKYGGTAGRLLRRDARVVAEADRQNRVNALIEWLISSG
jgi:hypothetical protein